MGSQQTTDAQHAAIRAAEETQNGLLRAQELLYTALRRPQPQRERQWADMVTGALSGAAAALVDHRLEVERGSGLYAELLRDAPWLEPRVRQIRTQIKRIEEEIIDLQIEVARVSAGDHQPLHRIRADTERMLFSLRDLLNKEADLIYERFNEPSAAD